MAVSAVKKEPAKSEAADAATAAAPSTKKSRKYLKLIIILTTVAGACGGGAYWYLHRHKGDTPVEAKPQPVKPPVYVPLEPFTVNLQLEEHPQFLQAGLSLKVADSAVGDALKVHMPEVRDRILLMLSARKASELLTVEGKRKLGADIVDAINAILSPAAPAVAPVAKVAKETPPAAEGETPAPAVAEGEEKPAEEAAAAAAPASAPAPAAPLPIVSVLFTSFIIQ